MDLQEAADMASGIAGELETGAMSAIESVINAAENLGESFAPAVTRTEELTEFVEQLHTVLSNDESGGVHQLRAELAEALTTAQETAAATTEALAAAQEAASVAQDKASTLAGALASMRDR